MSWEELLRDEAALRSAIRKSSAVNVNSSALKQSAKALVQLYFRSVEPELSDFGIQDPSLDEEFQYLLSLSNGNNARSRYIRVLANISRGLRGVEAAREMALGRRTHGSSSEPSGVERLIIRTLEAIVPSAALSYRQAIRDFVDPFRLSYRGTANELRECMRETIDYLAPDEKVSAQPGFKLEKDLKRPTTAQKVRFVLRERDAAKESIETVQRSASLVDELTASLARHVSSRSSKSTHTRTEKNEVSMIKRYVDTLLCELLEIPVS